MPEKKVQAAQLNELFNDRQELKRLSENCKQRVVELSWESKVQRVKEKYEEFCMGDALSLK